MGYKSLSLYRAQDDGLWSAVASLLVLTALVFFALLNPAFAQQRVLTSATLTDSTDGLSLAPNTLLLKDPQNTVTPATIRSSGGRVLTGSMVDGRMIHLGYDGTPVWLTVKLKGDALNNNWVMDPGRRSDGRIGYFKSLKVYELSVETTGIVLKELQEENGVYNITIAQGVEKLVLFNIRPASGRPSTLPLEIYSEKSYLNHVQKRSVLNTVFCVLFAGWSFFFIPYALACRKLSYGLYAAHFAVITLAWVLYNSVIANSGASIVGLLIPACLLAFMILSIQITRSYWNIEQSHYTEKYILHGLIWLNVSVFILGFILPINNGLTHALLFYGTPIMTMVIIALMSLAQSSAQKNYFFFFTWLPPLLGLSITAMASFDILQQNTFFLNAFWYMFLPHGILMAAAVYFKDSAMQETRTASTPSRADDVLMLDRIKQTKDAADHSRLLKVIEKEREMLADLRTKEEARLIEMEHAKEEADEANRAKSAFLAVVSHEIRTPMTGVMGMVRLLMDSSLTKQQRDYAMTIQESSEAMLGLLNDILDFEKIQRGKIELESISFDLHRLIQGVVTLMSGHAAQKNIGLSARMNDDLPRFVKGDPTRLRQILLNLMGNGIKFTSTGSVTLLVRLMTQTEIDKGLKKPTQKHMIYFAVQDTGIGIPADAQKNLFNPFSQANSTITRKFGGTGLGLAISKGLVENMGGAININSREGEGSTFFFTLEMEPGIATTQEQLKAAEPDEPAKPLKVLVVDDNAITTMVVIGFLKQGNHTIETASSAEDALRKIEADNFDMVLMDIELPGMPGNEATKILRDHRDPSKSNLPIFAMTGNVEKEYLERYMADGMSGFLTKPLDPDKLKSIISDVSKKTYEREITAPIMQSIKPAVAQFAAETPPEAPVYHAPVASIPDNVFNPEMLQSLKEAIGGPQLHELLGDLVTKTDEILQAMIDASRDNDMAALAARAHELKGMAGNFGLVEISSIAAQAEKKAKTLELEGMDALIAALPNANERAQSALKQWVSD